MSVPTKASARTVKPCGPVPPTLGSSFSQDVREKRRWLTVEPQEVVLCQTESADRRLKIYAAMRPVPIVFV